MDTAKVRTYLAVAKHRALEIAARAREKAVRLASNRAVQMAAASAAGGAVIVGGWGAAAGLFVGGAVGAVVGLLPALLTLGMSIPVAAAVGGSCGLVSGGVAGATAGAAGAGAAGFGAYSHRADIAHLATQVQEKFSSAQARAAESCSQAGGFIGSRAAAAQETACNALALTKSTTVGFVTDKTVQVTAASATGGAVLLGAGGAATGLVTGTAIGAAAGVVPALFTFGLSIPLFAALGGGCGAVAGTAVGASTGFVAGGASGYGLFTRREAIRSAINSTMSTVDDCASYVKDTASTSAGYVRSRLVGATGGTSD